VGVQADFMLVNVGVCDGVQPQLKQIGLAELPFVISPVAPQCMASADGPALTLQLTTHWRPWRDYF
jgi:hypothetical protein